MKRLPIFFSIVAIYVLINFLVSEPSGFNFQCKNDECRYIASSSINGIIFGFILGITVFFIPRKKIEIDNTSIVGIFRRIGAMYINLFVVMAPIAAIITMPILLIEAWHTGEFQWSFYREFSRSTDWLAGALSTLPVFVAIIYYYFKSLKKNSPTIGQYLMGYYITGNDEEWTTKRAMKRIGWTMLTMCIWPVTIIIALRNPQKAFWFDLKTNSLAARFDYTQDTKKS